MKDERRTKKDLIDELAQLRRRVTELEASEIGPRPADATFRDTNELLEKIFSTTHLLIAYMDTNFNFIRVNHAYAAADGREPEFFVSKNHFDLYPHEDNESIFRHVVETGEPHTAYARPFEYAEHPERGVTYWDWTLHPVKDASGKVEGLVLGLVNITERIKVEAELTKHHEHLEVLVEERTHKLKAAKEELEQEIEERRRVEEKLKWELAVTSALSELYKPLISPRASIENIANTILKQARKLTRSMYGYVSSIHPTTGDSIVHTLTHMMKGECAVSEENQRIVFPRGEDGLYPGLWGHALNTLQAFFSNSPETHEASGGIPEGHIPIQRFLSVPVILGQELVGQIALANKADDYMERDLEAVHRMAEYYALAIQRTRAAEALQKKTHELAERVKELNCLYRISNLVEKPGISLEEILQGTVDLIPFSWEYPEVTCARIILQGQEFRSENFRETVWKQADDIVVHGERIGSLQVCYLEEKPESDEGPFLKEERRLLKAIVERLGRLTEHMRAEEALRESEEKYRSMMEAMHDPVYICSPDFRVEYMNPAMLQRIGHDATGELCYKAINDLDEKCPWCVHEKIQQGEHAETEIVSPRDGRSYHVSQSPIFHVDGSISKMTIFTDITEQKQAEEKLRNARDTLEQRVKERTAELQSLSSRLLDVQEDERKRIAGDLHDGIGQSLSAIKFSVESVLNRLKEARDPSTLDTLSSLVPMLQDAIGDVRKTVMNLRPSILDDLGILATISWFFRQFQAVYSGIRIEEQIDVQEPEVPDALKTNIFRVLQEATNNITKHSKADRVRVGLRKQENSLELVIEDNGCGFDPLSLPYVEDAETGFGITSMKERTELSGGSFSIESRKGAGTTVQASWPYGSAKSIW